MNEEEETEYESPEYYYSALINISFDPLLNSKNLL